MCHAFSIVYDLDNSSIPSFIFIGIELEELMKQLCTPIAHRWCWFGILLGVKKPILVRISRGFAASGDVKHSLEEVIRSWLEMKHNPQRPHSWATIQDVVQRMGNEALARELGELCIATLLFVVSNYYSECFHNCGLAFVIIIVKTFEKLLSVDWWIVAYLFNSISIVL